MTTAIGTVITVFRGGCEVVHGDRIHELRLLGRHAERALSLAVGDELSFDPDQAIVLELLPRTTRLSRRRPRSRRGARSTGEEKVLAANMDRVAIVSSVAEPEFRPGVVDRLMVAAAAGGLEAVLIVNKIDLLAGAVLPEEIRAYRQVVPVYETSARERTGLEALRTLLAGSRTVLAGHSGVGKSSLLNALDPELRLETREVRASDRRGRHTTTRALWIRLPGGAIVVDTPGIRELETGPVDRELLDAAYPDVARLGAGCRFRDCRHESEPACAVRDAAAKGDLAAGRLANYRKLRREIAAQAREY
jgi:ribosome biogenesis GTPase